MASRAACYQSWQAGGAEDVLSYVILDRGEMAQRAQLKGNFHIKNSGKETWMKTNGLEVGGNTSQSPQTHITFHGNTAEEEEGMEDQSLLRAEQMAQAVRGQCHPVIIRKICKVILEYAFIFTCPSHVIK